MSVRALQSSLLPLRELAGQRTSLLTQRGHLRIVFRALFGNKPRDGGVDLFELLAQLGFRHGRNIKHKEHLSVI